MNGLSELKQGDSVIVSTRHDSRISTVEKITPKGFIKVGEKLFDQRGYLRGGDVWSNISIAVATPEKIKQIEERDVIRKAKQIMSIANPTYEQALRVIDIFRQYEIKD